MKRRIEGIDDIEKIVCHEYGIPASEIYQRVRERHIVMCRFTVYYLAQKHLTMKQNKGLFARLSRRYNQHHATVIYGIQQIKNYLEVKDPYRPIIENCEAKMNVFYSQ